MTGLAFVVMTLGALLMLFLTIVNWYVPQDFSGLLHVGLRTA